MFTTTTMNGAVRSQASLKGWETRRARKIRAMAMPWLITSAVIVITSCVFFNFFALKFQNPVSISFKSPVFLVAKYAEAKEVIKEVPKQPVTLQDHVWKIMTEEYGLSFTEAARGLEIVQCESGWNPYAVNKNRNGSFDFGLWMINEPSHKDITRQQMFDVYASTRYAMKLYREQGWNPWVCNKKI